MKLIEAIRYFANGKLNRLERKGAVIAKDVRATDGKTEKADIVLQIENLSNPSQLAIYKKEFHVRTKTDLPLSWSMFNEVWEARPNYKDGENGVVTFQPGNYKQNELLTTIEYILKHTEKKGKLTTIDFPDGTTLTLTLLAVNSDTILYEVLEDGTLKPYMIRLDDVRQFEKEDLL